MTDERIIELAYEHLGMAPDAWRVDFPGCDEPEMLKFARALLDARLAETRGRVDLEPLKARLAESKVTRLGADEISEEVANDRDCPFEEGWRIHDFPDQPAHIAYYWCDGLEEAEAKLICEAINALPDLIREIEEAREMRLKLDRRIHAQRKALRDNWMIVEQRQRSNRRFYEWLFKPVSELLDLMGVPRAPEGSLGHYTINHRLRLAKNITQGEKSG